MKLGIMQPYFFPYLGYFSLIKYSDKWVVFDPVQYIRHGWINRNRILKPNEGCQYILVPVQKHSRDTLITNVKTKEDTDWKTRIIRQMEHYKKKAPFYNEVINFAQDCFSIKTESLTLLNTFILEKTCDYLRLDFNYEIFSEMNLKMEDVTDAGEWALRISKALGAQEYVNPPGGRKIFDKTKFDKANITLTFLTSNLKKYDQKRNYFEPGLSIIDVMMFNSPEKINIMLDDYLLG